MAHVPTALAATVAALLATPSSAQRGGGFWYYGGPGRPQSGVMLLTAGEVRAELGTTAGQNAELDRLAADAIARSREAFDGYFRDSRALGGGERDERRDAVFERLAEIDGESDAKLAAILEPGQIERLVQLKLQAEGVAAVARPEVAERLGLSPEQKDRAARLVEAYRSRRDLPPPRTDDLRPPGNDEERERLFAQGRERREKTEAGLLSLLTPEQKGRWEAARGKTFAFPQRPSR